MNKRDLPPDLQQILRSSFALRVTHRGRRSNQARVLETTYYWDGHQQIFLSGYPGKRDWVANMAKNPDVTVYTVEGFPWYQMEARARVLRESTERTPQILRYIQRWTRHAGGGRTLIRWVLQAIRLNRSLHLPWWGPFYPVKRLFDRMPCVELTLINEPRVRRSPPPEMSDP